MNVEKENTCLTEIGKVREAESSGVLTMSRVIRRQLLQTPAQATTFLLQGQAASAVSILQSTSLSSSSGICAQELCSNPSTHSSCTTRFHLPLIFLPRMIRPQNPAPMPEAGKPFFSSRIELVFDSAIVRGVRLQAWAKTLRKPRP